MLDKAKGLIRGLVGGKTGRPPIGFDRTEAVRLRAEGWSLRKIAEKFGVSKSLVGLYLSEPKSVPNGVNDGVNAPPVPQVVQVDPPVPQVETPVAQVAPEAQPAAPTAWGDSLAALLNPGASASQPEATPAPEVPSASEAERPAIEISPAPENVPTVEPPAAPEAHQEPWLVELRAACKAAAEEAVREAAEKLNQ